MTMRVIIAARLSRKLRKGDAADGRDGIGIETQDQRSQEFAQREGYTVVATVPDTKSGTVPPWKRKNLSKWVTDPALLARYDAILAYDTDRVSRGRDTDFAEIEAWAGQHGKRIIIVNGGFQYPMRDGNESDFWQWTATKRRARSEWETIRERSIRAQRAILASGKHVGKFPYGYTLAGGKYAKDMSATAEGKRLVPEIMRRVWQERQTLGEIALWLEGVTGQRWYPRTVGTIVRNETYSSGEHVVTLDGETFTLTCEPLCDAESQRRAIAELDRRPKRGAPRPEGRALVAGSLYCPRCAGNGRVSPMYRIKAHSGFAYRCTGRGSVSERKGCGAMFSLSAVDALVHEAMTQSTEEIQRAETRLPTDHDKVIAQIARRVKSLDPVADDYDEAYTALMTELKAAKAAKVADTSEGPSVTYVGTGQTYAGMWRGFSSDAERGDWLRGHGVKVYAGHVSDVVSQLKPSIPGMLAKITVDPETDLAVAVIYDEERPLLAA